MYNIIQLNDKNLSELQAIAQELGCLLYTSAEGYIKTIALDKNDEICRYEFVHMGKFMDEIKKGTDANEALKMCIRDRV